MKKTETRKITHVEKPHIRHNGKIIGSVRKGKVAVVATYPATKQRSVILARDTVDEAEHYLTKLAPWRAVAFEDVEYVIHD